MKNLVIGYFECISINEIDEMVKKYHINETMVFEITNDCGGTFRFYGYGYFNGDAEDWGFEDASESLFSDEEWVENLKERFEVMRENGELE